MVDEVDPMRDLGLVHDKEFVIEPQGIFTPCNTARDLCAHFIPNGGKIFDLIERYDAITTLVLNNNGSDSGTLGYIAPFLKAFGATDYTVSRFFKDSITFNPGSKECARYVIDIMPSFIVSTMYEPAVSAVCDYAGFPLDVTGSTPLELDTNNMSTEEKRNIRDIAADIAKLRIPGDDYIEGTPLELNDDEVKLVGFLDNVFHDELNGTCASDLIQNTSAVGLSAKAYALLDIRKTIQVDLDGVMFAGSESTDFQAMDLVNEGNGLAVSFNGTEAAVHGSNVALVDTDCTSLTFLASVFFDTGAQGVMDLADNWNYDYLRSTEFPDMNLYRKFMEMHPDKLPELYRITDENVSEVAVRSDKFRTKMMSKQKLLSLKHNK